MMRTVERSVELPVSVGDAYALLTDFSAYPLFLPGVESVRRTEDDHLEWVAGTGPGRRSWRAAITEMIPQTSVAWATAGETRHAGVISLEPLAAARTLLTLRLDYEDRPGDPEVVADLSRLAETARDRAPLTPQPAPRLLSIAAVGDARVTDPVGESLGAVVDAFVDPDTLRVEFVAIRGGTRDRAHLVPVDVGLDELSRGIALACTREQVRTAPTVEPGVEPSEEMRERARRHARHPERWEAWEIAVRERATPPAPTPEIAEAGEAPAHAGPPAPTPQIAEAQVADRAAGTSSEPRER